MSEPDLVEVEDRLRLTRMSGAGPVRDVELLEAACAQCRARVLGDEAYPTLGLKVAALLHSLARDHGLVEGNTRLAWFAAVVFLDLNGHPADLDDDAAFELVMAAAHGHLDVELIARRLDTWPG